MVYDVKSVQICASINLQNMDYPNVTSDTPPHTVTSILNTTTDGLDVDAYLVMYMGERRKDPVSVGVLTFVYVSILLTGIVGNICTCVVIAKNAFMQTATNYYLFSLAVSDMLTLIFGLPTELYAIWEAYPWPFGEPYCIFKSFLSEMTSYASVLTITSFTIERYVAICHPIKAQTLSNLSRAVKIVFSIWIISALIALPYPIHTRVFPYVVVNGTALMDSLQCNVPFQWQRGMTVAFQISTFLFFIFPMIIISVMYYLISANLKKSLIDSKHKSKTNARKAVVRMLVAVVVAFFCQWAPFHAQRLMTLYMPIDKWTPTLIRFQTDLFYVSGVLYYCNSTINPILYNMMSKKFRLAFKRTFCRCLYHPDDLVDLNGRSKSFYYSDRSLAHSLRHTANDVTKLSFTDLNGVKSNLVLVKTDANGEYSLINNGNRHLSRSRSHHSQSTGRLNDFFSNIHHASSGCRINENGLKHGGSKLHLSSSSFEEAQSDSLIELKSLSSYSSSTQLNSRLIVPQKGFRVNKGSYI